MKEVIVGSFMELHFAMHSLCFLGSCLAFLDPLILAFYLVLKLVSLVLAVVSWFFN
jgi:hypothetical protein